MIEPLSTGFPDLNSHKIEKVRSMINSGSSKPQGGVRTKSFMDIIGKKTPS